MSERECMERAVEISRHCRSEPGKVSPPKVGALILQDGEMLGEAFRGGMAEGEHAEFTLLETEMPNATLAGRRALTTCARATRSSCGASIRLGRTLRLLIDLIAALERQRVAFRSLRESIDTATAF